MKNQATGAELQDYYVNHWPNEFYHDDSAIELVDDDGNWLLEPATMYNLADLGWLHPQATGTEPIGFKEAFLDWKEKRDYVTITIRGPKPESQDVQTALVKAGFHNYTIT
jgi:hypothetical protein